MSKQDLATDLREAQQRVATQSVERENEVNDLNLRAIVLFTLGLLVIIVVALLVLRWLVGAWSGEKLSTQIQVPPALATPPAVPGPGIRAVPYAELQRVLTTQEERLSSYGWVDKNRGVVHVPIERAMQLLLNEGLPSQNVDPPDFGLPPAYKMEGSGGQESATK
ncbi:MAG: hypothetical protein U0175_19790 [Caldilineaceae bacterium]